MDYTSTPSFLSFAWNTLTEHQQIRIRLRYELKEKLKNHSGCKRDVYRLVADEYCLSMLTVEKIANTDLKDK